MMNVSSTPFRVQLERDASGRISRKIEYVAGREPRERSYRYDRAGQLVAVNDGRTDVETYEYDTQGRRIRATWLEPDWESQTLDYREHYTGETRLFAINGRRVYHDENGFRETAYLTTGEEHYEYAPDYRLLKVTKTAHGSQPLTIEFDHGQEGRRCEKYTNGQLTELYDWHDLIRLAAAETHGQRLEFHYRDGERVPAAATLNGEHLLYLHYDQVGSLRVVADEYGNVVKEVRYTAFGVIEEDTNPDLYMPIGFAGGVHDRDLGWVRFGFRDYDPLTARFTAKDPLGYAGGDSDVYGYCLDDPVNGVDPMGLQSVEFDGEQMRWLDSNGTETDAWGAMSGPWGKGRLPEGNYSGSNLRPRTRKGMVCPDGKGWSVDLKPDVPSDRTDLRIHPDGGDYIGTSGCIGVTCKDADAAHDKLKGYFEDNRTIPVRVRYNK